MSIRARIALIVLVVSSALIFAGVWFFDRQLVAGLNETIDETLDARAAPLVALVGDTGAPVDRVASSPVVWRASLRPSPTSSVPTERWSRRRSGRQTAAAAVLPTERLGDLDRRRYFVVTTDLSPMLEETRVLTVPVERADGSWTVVVGSSMEITERAQSVRTGFILGGVVAVAISHRRCLAAGQRRVGAGGAHASRRRRHHRW